MAEARASDEQLTQPTQPSQQVQDVYRHTRRSVAFPNAHARHQLVQAQSDAVDPVIGQLQEIRALPGDAEQRLDLLFSDVAYMGLRTPAEAATTVKQWLAEIIDETRSFQQVVECVNFDARCCHPLPYWNAVQRFAGVNGFYPEVLALLLQCNLSLLEHPKTGLTHHVNIKHRVSSAQSVHAALPPSFGKTSMQEISDAFLFDASGADSKFSERRIAITDATKKGVGNLLLNERVGLCSSSEGANTMFAAGLSDQYAGLHFISKSRFCQYSQSEGVSTATGQGLTTLEPRSYAFAMKMLSQDPVFNALQKPGTQAHQKRFAIAAVPSAFVPDATMEALPVAGSTTFLQDLHSYLATNITPVQAEVKLSGYALTLYESVATAIKEVLQEHALLQHLAPPHSFLLASAEISRWAGEVIAADQLRRIFNPSGFAIWDR